MLTASLFHLLVASLTPSPTAAHAGSLRVALVILLPTSLAVSLAILLAAGLDGAAASPPGQMMRHRAAAASFSCGSTGPEDQREIC